MKYEEKMKNKKMFRIMWNDDKKEIICICYVLCVIVWVNK